METSQKFKITWRWGVLVAVVTAIIYEVIRHMTGELPSKNLWGIQISWWAESLINGGCASFLLWIISNWLPALDKIHYYKLVDKKVFGFTITSTVIIIFTILILLACRITTWAPYTFFTIEIITMFGCHAGIFQEEMKISKPEAARIAIPLILAKMSSTYVGYFVANSIFDALPFASILIGIAIALLLSPVITFIILVIGKTSVIVFNFFIGK